MPLPWTSNNPPVCATVRRCVVCVWCVCVWGGGCVSSRLRRKRRSILPILLQISFLSHLHFPLPPHARTRLPLPLEKAPRRWCGLHNRISRPSDNNFHAAWNPGIAYVGSHSPLSPVAVLASQPARNVKRILPQMQRALGEPCIASCFARRINGVRF